MTATIDDFLKSGQFGELTIGSSKESVRGLLGAPGDVSVQKNPEIWKYGALQLAFYKGSEDVEPHLTSLSIYFNDPETPIPVPFSLSDWPPTYEIGVGAFCEHLKDIGINTWNKTPSAGHDSIVLPSDVRVSFVDGHLHSLHYTSRREPQVKQLTVSIPSKDLEIIRKEAAERRISMSALCSEWIKEHISHLQRVGSS